MVTVSTKKILDALKNRDENECALVEDTHKIYQFKNGEWVELNPADKAFTITLMELNSMAVTQLPELESLEEAKTCIFDYVQNSGATYFMLLSNELRYYTVFHFNGDIEQNLPDVETEVLECAKELGVLKAVNKNDDGVVEMWITVDDRSYPLYFFDYEKGVIECQ